MYYGLLKEEIRQRRDEGCRIPASLLRRFNELHPKQDEFNSDLLDPIYQELEGLEPDPGLAEAEPNDLDQIRALRPDGPRVMAWSSSDDEPTNCWARLHGAWTGRAVGCALGKPGGHQCQT